MTNKQEAIDDLLGGLLTWGRQCGSILDHMAEYSGKEKGCEESLDVLAELLRGAIEPATRRRSPAELRMVAAVLLDIYHLAADELLFVTPGGDV